MSELVMNEAVRRVSPPVQTQGVMTVVLEGEIGQADLPDVSEMLLRLAERGNVLVVVDFTHVTHFDYRGVAPLMRLAEMLRRQDGDLKVAGLSPYLHAIYRSAGAHDAFDCFATAADARRSFGPGVDVPGR